MMHEGHDHEHCCGAHTHEHEHEHEHCHEHTHEHEHEHCHEHTHEHTHEHHHHHHHDEETIQVAEKYQKIATLVNYMANHNADHAEELVNMVGKLNEMGLTDAAAKLQEGVDEFKKGNEKLKESLAMIQKAE